MGGIQFRNKGRAGHIAQKIIGGTFVNSILHQQKMAEPQIRDSTILFSIEGNPSDY